MIKRFGLSWPTLYKFSEYELLGTELNADHINSTVECWPALVEHAYAKFCESYDILTNGFEDPLQFISDLVPDKIEKLPEEILKDHRSFISFVRNSEREVLDATVLFLARLKKSKNKIVGFHQYTSIHIFKPRAESEQPAVMVRNPWGNYEPNTGILSDKKLKKGKQALPKRYRYIIDEIEQYGLQNHFDDGVFIKTIPELFSSYDELVGIKIK